MSLGLSSARRTVRFIYIFITRLLTGRRTIATLESSNWSFRIIRPRLQRGKKTRRAQPFLAGKRTWRITVCFNVWTHARLWSAASLSEEFMRRFATHHAH